MHAVGKWMILSVWLLPLAFPFTSSAAVAITGTIDGVAITPGTDCKTLSEAGGAAKTYNNVTIAGYQPAGGAMSDARVGTGCSGTFDDDTVNDGLRFLTAVIKPVNAASLNVERTIEFVGTYNAPPTATGGTTVWYKLSGTGNFKRGAGAATSATVKAWGYVEASAGSGTWTQVTSSYLSKTIGVTSGFFGVPPLSQPFPLPNIPAAPTQHRLKVVFKFKFIQATDELRIDNSNGIVLYSSSAPGDDGEFPDSIHIPLHGKPCPEGVPCYGTSKK